MINCTINGTRFNYPSQWDELTRENLFSIAKGFVLGLSAAEFRMKLLLDFLGFNIVVKPAIYKDGEKLYELKTADKKHVLLSGPQMLEMADKLSFVTKEIKNEHDQVAYAIESKLTINLVPTFKHRFTTYYGPSDKLFNISFVEYITAEGYFSKYINNQDPLLLDKLVATLYRKRSYRIRKSGINYRGDIRQKFNDHLIDRRARKLKNMNPEVKTAIALFYEGCRTFLQKQFPDVFKSAASGGKKSGVPGMLALVDALTLGDVTKTEQVRGSYLYDVMVHLQKSIENAEEMKENMKKKKP